MRLSESSVSRGVGCLLLLASFPAVAAAQVRINPAGTGVRTSDSKPSKTIVSVELLADKQAGGLAAQQWGQTFEKIGYAVRIRRAILDEKPEVKERMLGRLREVTVIGKLDRSGKLVFPERTFSLDEATKLAEWLRSLEVYGAQGSPKGQPVWGLSQTQFDILYTALSQKLDEEVEGKPLSAALAVMKLPPDYPVRFTTAANSLLGDSPAQQPPVRMTLKGHSKGTALALLLSGYGLGFRPLRTPEGGIELSIESLEKTTDVWPVGWDLKETRLRTAPQMFKLVPVELQDVKLLDALEGVASLTEVPIHVDRRGITAHGIDVDEIVISYPRKRTSWSLLLRGITTPHKLTREFRIDEKGRPFVWVTAFVPRRTAE